MDRLARYPTSALADQSTPSLQAYPRLSDASVRVPLVHRSFICPDKTPVSVTTLQELRKKLLKIEQPALAFEQNDFQTRQFAWTLGIAELDAALDRGSTGSGLECCSVHEVKHYIGQNKSKASAAASWAVALGFALRLALRRLITSNQCTAIPSLILCQTKSLAAEYGRFYGPGLLDLGFDTSQIIFVETTRASDALWAMEEALKSGVGSLVIGVLDEVGLIEGRRLSLATQSHGTPCLLITHGARAACATASTRWRVGTRASTLNNLDVDAPGKFTANVAIERCRPNPSLSQSVPFALEWCNETHSFGMSSSLAHRTPHWSHDTSTLRDKY
jgi:hypothetical protein